ncbi:hypothetical protein [Sphingomonas astaxanthinifaciens]|uniref:BON domain-containing protein n=1 Tax=Sphingomonas astaxanthinifaciens DSM 22298 TaxID=1123267 RepID=A0ABQ5Z6H4_9SPHN|nr:hypothetical protein [Sphingomonas astaxanthinifaciens]GLR46488.1 hypothetical protein GCM10007925_01990 [Sphingomonas astaxanthinifaciens DSM 22298]
MNRRLGLLAGALASIGVAELYHGPLGASDDLKAKVEAHARNLLDYYELPQVTARMDESPRSRRLILKGPADDFQRRALVEKIGQLPGVNEVRWDPSSPVVDYWAERRRSQPQ